MSKYRDRDRDWDFMGWVKTQPCAAVELSQCSGAIEADHAGRRGLSHKADDRTCIPLCQLHHRQRTDHAGPFRPWSRDQMRVWLDAQITETQLRYIAQTSPVGGIPF